MGCLCPKKERIPTNNLNEKLNDESETIKAEDIEAHITIGVAEKNDLPQKRKLAEFLLSSDLNIFKRHLAEVRKLSDKDFNELFEGNTEHKFNVQSEKDFRQLVQKFDDNKDLLSQFYNKEKYYDFILKIWRPNILQNIKNAKNDEEKNVILKKYKIDISTLDEEDREDFKIIMDMLQ